MTDRNQPIYLTLETGGNYVDPGAQGMLADTYQPPDNAQMSTEVTTAPRGFMADFKPQFVTNPNPTRLPDGFQIGKHPYWLTEGQGAGPPQLIDPVTKTTIAFYSYDARVPYFYSFGFLRKNPRLATDSTWCWDPKERPYKEKTGEEEEGKFSKTSK